MYIANAVINKAFSKTQNGMLAQNYSVEDALQDGYVGLCYAACGYKSDRNTLFSTYAYTVVKNYIIRQIKSYSRIKEENILDDESYTEIGSVCKSFCDCETKEAFDFISKTIAVNKEKYDKRNPLAYDVLILRFKGYEKEEIARQFNLNSKEVNYKYSLALSDLRRKVIRKTAFRTAVAV